jgi:hypothetical protein
MDHTAAVLRDPPEQAAYRFPIKCTGPGMSAIYGTFMPPAAYQHRAQPMRTYLPSLSAAAWALIALPALVAARCVVMTVVPQVIHAVVPEVVRSVLRII